MTTNTSERLVQVEYKDEEGLWCVVLVPEGSDESTYHMGIEVGPPDLSSLDLPKAVKVRLHNELFRRRLLTRADLRGRGMEVFAAVQAAYKADTAAVTALYR